MTYAGLMARNTGNPNFNRIALFDREKFYLFLSRGGGFVSAIECHWTTPGSKQLMQSFFNVPSPLVKALKASCRALKLTPCLPEIGNPCILGAGGTGVVFRVEESEVDESTVERGRSRSQTAAMRHKALKVVVGDSGVLLHLHREWTTTKSAQTLTDRVVTVGAIHIGDGFGAYVMDEVGSPVETTSEEQQRALFLALYDLHIRGIVHGDPRVPNVISLAGEITWIDFTTASIALTTETAASLFGNDFRILFDSVFDEKPSARAIDAYLQCVGAKKGITAEEFVTIGVK